MVKLNILYVTFSPGLEPNIKATVQDYPAVAIFPALRTGGRAIRAPSLS